MRSSVRRAMSALGRCFALATHRPRRLISRLSFVLLPLPQQTGAINALAIHPTEFLMASASSDKTIRRAH
eukprot:4154522-Pleurochrysis_carterae.AAC.3